MQEKGLIVASIIKCDTIQSTTSNVFFQNSVGTEYARFDSTGVFQLVNPSSFAAGTAAAPSITATGDTNTGIFFPAADTIAFAEGGVEAMRLNSAGNMGLGVTPEGWSLIKGLQVTGGGFFGAYNNNSYMGANWYFDGTNKYIASDFATQYEQNDGKHIWYTAPSGTAGNAITWTQAMTLDASGNLLVGSTSANQNIRIGQKLGVVSTGSGTYGGVGISSYSGTSASVAPVIDINRSRGTTDQSFTAVASGDYLGYIVFRGSDGTGFTDAAYILGAVDGTVAANQVPGRLVFHIANSAGTVTERVRIDSSGNLLVGTTTSNARASFYNASSAGPVALVQNARNVSGDVVNNWLIGSNANNTSSYFLQCGVSGVANVLYIYGNGNVQNTNNSYGAISDVKLKENIVDATPKLADLMQVKVRSYNLKSDPLHKQLGVIAQELETIFPGLIDESPDYEPQVKTREVEVPAVAEVRDNEGNIVTEAVEATTKTEEYTEQVALGTTTKAVKYSVFVPMLIKAMQEQQALITTLTARITALEGA